MEVEGERRSMLLTVQGLNAKEIEGREGKQGTRNLLDCA
jgi:hypothetical protein